MKIEKKWVTAKIIANAFASRILHCNILYDKPGRGYWDLIPAKVQLARLGIINFF